MTQEDADTLAKRIINCWRGGPPLVEWYDELRHLDAGMAGTVFVRLRRELEHAPSIARFLAEYRSVHGPDVSHPARHDEERMSLDEYLARLSHRSAQGNTAAGEELDRWGRWLSPKPRTIAARRERLRLDAE